MSINHNGNIISYASNGLNNPTSTVEYLVVSGGGGGANSALASGGGGAGGLLTGTGYPITLGTAITVTVGAGQPVATASATNGNPSAFGSISPKGGGNANAQGSLYGVPGGSGCGANYGDPVGLGTAGQGNNGGLGSGTYYYVGGGGGGAGAAGSAGTQSSAPYQRPGAGGTGLLSLITGAPVFYAGGGGGGVYEAIAGTQPAPGGAGGGGNGVGRDISGYYIRATDGLANTGGGGGGMGNGPAAQGVGGNGGSGIVIIRYPSYLAPAVSTTGSPSMYVINGWRVYEFIASGTITF